MTDLEFVQRCIATDKQSWDQFVKQYSRLIYSAIHGVFRSYGMASEPDRINDIFQDLFILLRRDDFRKLKSYKAKNGCSLASWLRTVVVNFTIDHLRKIKRTVSIDAEDELELSLKDILADDSAIASEMLIEQEKFAVLKDCIELLDGDSKLFVNLSINRGVSPDELSEIFKVSRGAIDMRKLRIIDKLKECFKNKGFLR